MEIQWLIIADSAELRSGMLTIRHIFTEAIADGPPYLVSLVIIAKAHQEVSDIGETKRVTVDITDTSDRTVALWNLAYPALSYAEWLEASPYVLADQTIPFPTPGDYLFRLSVDGVFKTSEWMKVVDRKGGSG